MTIQLNESTKFYLKQLFIIGMILLLTYSYAKQLVIPSYAKPQITEFDSDFIIIDDNVIEYDKDYLSKLLKNFYNKTGIQVYISFKDNRKQIENNYTIQNLTSNKLKNTVCLAIHFVYDVDALYHIQCDAYSMHTEEPIPDYILNSIRNGLDNHFMYDNEVNVDTLYDILYDSVDKSVNRNNTTVLFTIFVVATVLVVVFSRITENQNNK